MTKLKPCPFCGSGVELLDFTECANLKHVTIACCGCDMAIRKPTKEAAIEAWNKRAE